MAKWGWPAFYLSLSLDHFKAWLGFWSPETSWCSQDFFEAISLTHHQEGQFCCLSSVFANFCSRFECGNCGFTYMLIFLPSMKPLFYQLLLVRLLACCMRPLKLEVSWRSCRSSAELKLPTGGAKSTKACPSRCWSHMWHEFIWFGNGTSTLALILQGSFYFAMGPGSTGHFESSRGKVFCFTSQN